MSSDLTSHLSYLLLINLIIYSEFIDRPKVFVEIVYIGLYWLYEVIFKGILESSKFWFINMFLNNKCVYLFLNNKCVYSQTVPWLEYEGVLRDNKKLVHQHI